MSTRVQLVIPVAHEVYARTFWGDTSGGARPCPASWKGYHDAKAIIRRVEGPEEPDLRAEVRRSFPRACAFCGAPAPEDAHRHVVAMTVYRGTLDGEERVGLHGAPGSRFGLRPGDAYWMPWYHEEEPGVARTWCPAGWEGCADPRGHLGLVLPDGTHFDCQSRAANCPSKEDKVHRCWSVDGSPEGGDLTLGKRGPTCAAGAGSIDTGRWHGFVRDGRMEP